MCEREFVGVLIYQTQIGIKTHKVIEIFKIWIDLQNKKDMPNSTGLL